MMISLMRGLGRVGRRAKGIAINKTFRVGGLASALILWGSAALCAEITPSDKVKAAYLLHFTSYVSWPKHDLTGVNLCLMGDDPFGSYIDEMVDAKPLNRHGQKIVIQRLQVTDSFKQCHILYEHFDRRDHQSELVGSIQPGILYVGDNKNYLASHGMIRFFVRSNRVRLQVNLQRVRTAGLNISSELLKISNVVGEE